MISSPLLLLLCCSCITGLTAGSRPWRQPPVLLASFPGFASASVVATGSAYTVFGRLNLLCVEAVIPDLSGPPDSFVCVGLLLKALIQELEKRRGKFPKSLCHPTRKYGGLYVKLLCTC